MELQIETNGDIEVLWGHQGVLLSWDLVSSSASFPEEPKNKTELKVCMEWEVPTLKKFKTTIWPQETGEKEDGDAQTSDDSAVLLRQCKDNHQASMADLKRLSSMDSC